MAAKGRDRLYAVSGDAAEAAVVLGTGFAGSVVASGDGGMLAFQREDKVVVVERGSGVEREFGLEWDYWPAALSAGGGRLVVWSPAGGQGRKTCTVVETATGRVAVRVETGDDWWNPWVVEEGALRMFRLEAEGAAGQAPEDGPWPIWLVGHDLVHGSEIGRVAVPGLVAGTWDTGLTEDAGAQVLTIMGHRVPGLAVSADGRRVAVVHPEGDVLTTIDARSFVVERSVAVVEKRSMVDRLAAWLPLVPRGAAAKVEEGSVRQAVFGVDGRWMYVWGTEARAETRTRTGAGLQRIDVETGEIEASGLDEQEVVRMMPLDGGLYVGSWDPGFALRRLDPVSLKVWAERRFGGWTDLVSVRV